MSVGRALRTMLVQGGIGVRGDLGAQGILGVRPDFAGSAGGAARFQRAPSGGAVFPAP